MLEFCATNWYYVSRVLGVVGGLESAVNWQKLMKLRSLCVPSYQQHLSSRICNAASGRLEEVPQKILGCSRHAEIATPTMEEVIFGVIVFFY